MARADDLVYCLCVSDSGTASVCGWVLEQQGEDVILGTVPIPEVANSTKAKTGTKEVGFVRVGLDSVSTQQPREWKGPRPSELPDITSCRTAWKKVSADLVSSETEPVEVERPQGRRPRRGLASDLGNLQGLFAGVGGEGDDTDDDDEDLPPKGGRGSFLAPGQSISLGDRKKKKAESKKEDELDLKRLVASGLASGQSPSDLLPVMMMGLLLDRDQGSKKKKKDRASSSNDDLGLLGFSSSGSSSESEGGHEGMKAVSTLHRMHRQIKHRPRKICELFEKEVIEELGIVPGQAWTLRDYVRKQSWGKFRGIYRCALMDVAAYELIRSNQADAAAAQLVQNLKAKIQCVLNHGDWETAWLLTGLVDPLQRREFAGTREEMSIVSSYLDSLAKLKKRLKETRSSGGAGGDDDEEPGAGANAPRK